MSAHDALAKAPAWRPTAPSPKAEFFSAASLAGQPVPERAWHVAELIPAGTVTMLGGDGGVGKSILALQLAVATAAGRRWLGQETAGGGALYLTAEDSSDELHRRLASIVAAEGLAFADLDRLSLCTLAGQDALLALFDQRSGALMSTDLFNELDARLDLERPALLVLDTLADLHSGQENDRTVARQFIALLRGLAMRHETTVVLLAHPSLKGMETGSGLSGSTAWSGSVRSRLFVERITESGYEADTNRRRLVVKKANYGPIGNDIALTWRDGVFVPDTPESGLDRATGSMKAERVFLALLRLHTDQGRHVNVSGGSTYAPKAFAEHPASEGVTQRALKAAMEALLLAGRIRNVETGPASKRRSHIEEVAR